MELELVSRNAALTEFKCSKTHLDQLPYLVSKNGYILYDKSDVLRQSSFPVCKGKTVVPSLSRLIDFSKEPKKMYLHPDYSTSKMCALPDHVLELIAEFVIADSELLTESIQDLVTLGRTSKPLRVMYVHGSRVLPAVAMQRFNDVPSARNGIVATAVPPVSALRYLRDHMDVTQAYMKDPMRLKLSQLNELIRHLPRRNTWWSNLKKQEKVSWTVLMLGLNSFDWKYDQDMTSCMMLLNYLYDKRLTQVLADLPRASSMAYAKEMYDVVIV